MFKRIALLLLTGITLQPVAHAGLISYEVNRSVGDFGTVTGIIKTDGTLGTLSIENIVDWNITLNADSNQATTGQLLGPLSGSNSFITIFPTTAIKAIANGSINALLIDFGTLESEAFQMTTWDYSVVWQMQPGIPFQDELVRESFENPILSPNQAYDLYGPVTHVLATASVVPLSSANLFFLTGLLAFSFFSKKQNNKPFKISVCQ